MDQKSVQTAVQDIALIRRLIDRSGTRDETVPTNASAFEAGMIFQIVTLVITLVLVGVEVFSTTSMTSTMLVARAEKDLGVMELGFAAATLAAILLCVYFIVWRSARSDASAFEVYVARNFRYLKNLPFLSDLISKAASLALIVLAGRTEWVTPLCVLFVGCYLIEGRFFHLPLRVSLSLGGAVTAGAVALFAHHETSLLYPLGVFAVCTALSIAHLYHSKTQLADKAE